MDIPGLITEDEVPPSSGTRSIGFSVLSNDHSNSESSSNHSKSIVESDLEDEVNSFFVGGVLDHRNKHPEQYIDTPLSVSSDPYNADEEADEFDSDLNSDAYGEYISYFTSPSYAT